MRGNRRDTEGWASAGLLAWVRALRAARANERKRRKSFSRFLKDSDKDRQGVLPAPPQTPSKDKEKEGSRGFMGSVRRISLVGKHKRTKSGSGLALGSVPPSPSSPFFSRHASSGTPASGRGDVPPVPYALPPLPASSTSQLSLRLPSGARWSDAENSHSASTATNGETTELAPFAGVRRGYSPSVACII